MDIKNIYKYLIAIVAVAAIVLCVFSDKLFFRLDLTQEKRYSISDNTKNMLKNADGDISVVVYLDGDLNAVFSACAAHSHMRDAAVAHDRLDIRKVEVYKTGVADEAGDAVHAVL